MSNGRITTDDALKYLVEQIEACELSTKDQESGGRINFEVMDLTDINGGITDNRSRVFAYYVLSQGPSSWCWGGEAIEIHLKIVYQGAPIYQDLVELKNHLEYKMQAKEGIAGFYTSPTFMENNDIGEDKVYVYMPIAIDYKPPRLQDES